MKRRHFFFSLASLSALFVTPALATADTEGEEVGALAATDKIKALEAYLKKHPEPFSWSVHNELRHLYGAISEAKAMEHADIILAHSFMDEYTLSILSDWQLDADPDRAVVALLRKAECFPSLVHVRAACLMCAGDACQEHGKIHEATKLYRGVLALDEKDAKLLEGVQQYRYLAQIRMSV